MAGNPFDQFDAPAAGQKGNAFDQFDAPSARSGQAPSAAPAAQPAQPPAAQDIGTLPIWQKPADVSWTDFELAHLARAFPTKAGSATGELAALGSGLSFGATNRIPGATEAINTLDPQERMILEGAGYLVGPGKLGIASRIGTPISGLLGGGKVAQYAGGVLGSGAEGALASGAPVAFQGGSAGDIASAAGAGALTGGAAGMLGGVVGRGGSLPAAQSASDLEAAAKTAWKPNDSVLFNQSEVKPVLDNMENTIAQSDLTGQQRKLATSTMAEVNNLRSAPQLSATDIHKAQQRLGALSSSPRASDQDQRFAPMFKNALEDVMQNGLSFNAPTGFAAATRDAGNALWSKAQDLRNMDEWAAKAATPGGPDVATQAGQYLRSGPGQTFAPPGSPMYQAFTTLGDATAKANAIPWYVKHYMLAPAIGIGANEAIQAATGEHETPMEHLGVDLATGLSLWGGSSLYGRLAAQRNLAAQQRALAAARATASTGQYQAPIVPDARFRDALRRLVFGYGAAGGY